MYTSAVEQIPSHVERDVDQSCNQASSLPIIHNNHYNSPLIRLRLSCQWSATSQTGDHWTASLWHLVTSPKLEPHCSLLSMLDIGILSIEYVAVAGALRSGWVAFIDCLLVSSVGRATNTNAPAKLLDEWACPGDNYMPSSERVEGVKCTLHVQRVSELCDDPVTDCQLPSPPPPRPPRSVMINCYN